MAREAARPVSHGNKYNWHKHVAELVGKWGVMCTVWQCGAYTLKQEIAKASWEDVEIFLQFIADWVQVHWGFGGFFPGIHQ